MRISDWSSDVCSSDLLPEDALDRQSDAVHRHRTVGRCRTVDLLGAAIPARHGRAAGIRILRQHDWRHRRAAGARAFPVEGRIAASRSRPQCGRSEEHTSELQSLMRISYAVFCLKIKKYKKQQQKNTSHQVQNTSKYY